MNISRGAVYYRPRPVSPEDLRLTRRIDELHLERSFEGARMLRDSLGREVPSGRPPACRDPDEAHGDRGDLSPAEHQQARARPQGFRSSSIRRLARRWTLISERARGLEVEADLALARAKASEDMALIAAQKLQIAKLERQVYGQRSERSARLIEQLALEFEELAANATEDELATEQAAAKTTTVRT